MKTVPVSLGDRSYDIIFGRGLLQEAGALLDLDRRVLIVTDTGVPARYAETLAAQCKAPLIETVPMGEGSKSISVFAALLEKMLAAGFTRKDCVVAVGGGVVGDLAGFTAASYMRGVDFYNVPTTVLSQVDSSVGGKTAVNLGGVKNVVGAFWQPKRVLIDPDTLRTLPRRQIANGLAEALKISVTCDAELFSLFENGDIEADLDTIICRALELKRDVVEADERESGLRRILNFGHTLGHGIESAANGALYHGECVALGMPPMCGEALRPRVVRALERLGLPVKYAFDRDTALSAVFHDKKSDGDSVAVVTSDAPGSCEIRKMSPDAFAALLDTIRL